jgi:iron(III) transport system substrate-binding protein
MIVVQDVKYFPGMKDLEKGLRRDGYKVYSSTGNMLEKVSSGEHILGYNIIGSYAMVRAKKDPNLGVVLPKDYSLVLSRVMSSARARRTRTREAVRRLHPVAARPEADGQRRGALRGA